MGMSSLFRSGASSIVSVVDTFVSYCRIATGIDTSFFASRNCNRFIHIHAFSHRSIARTSGLSRNPRLHRRQRTLRRLGPIRTLTRRRRRQRQRYSLPILQRRTMSTHLGRHPKKSAGGGRGSVRGRNGRHSLDSRAVFESTSGQLRIGHRSGERGWVEVSGGDYADRGVL